MLAFLMRNASTMLIALALSTAIAAIVRNMVRRARRGQCVSCDGCAGCAHRGACAEAEAAAEAAGERR